jgi:hypothetical protein
MKEDGGKKNLKHNKRKEHSMNTPFPPEIWLYCIFPHLRPLDLLTIQLTCKDLKKLVNIFYESRSGKSSTFYHYPTPWNMTW